MKEKDIAQKTDQVLKGDKLGNVAKKVITKVKNVSEDSAKKDHKEALTQISGFLANYPEKDIQALEEKFATEMQESDSDLEEVLLEKSKQLLLQSERNINISLHHFNSPKFLFSNEIKSIWTIPKNKPDEYAKLRNETEQQAFGFTGPSDWRTGIKEEAHSRPIYGGINFGGNPVGAAPDYGSVKFDLKKDILYRSMVTPCDSLNLVDKVGGRKDYEDLVTTIEYLDKAVANLDISQFKFIMARFLDKKVAWDVQNPETIELQILGGINPNDVEAIYISKRDVGTSPKQPGFDTVAKEVGAEKLESNLKLYGYRNNLPIYIINEKGTILKSIYRPGDKISRLPPMLPEIKTDKAKMSVEVETMINKVKDYFSQYEKLGDQKYSARIKFLQGEIMPYIKETFKNSKDQKMQNILGLLASSVKFELDRLTTATDSLSSKRKFEAKLDASVSKSMK